MGRLAEFPLCIYCDNDKFWSIDVDNGGDLFFTCQKCGHIIIVSYDQKTGFGGLNE